MAKEDERNRNPRGPGRGPGHGMGAGEKAKDFKSAIKRLFKELKGFRKLITVALILAILSAVLSILAPNRLSNLTDKISEGLVPPFFMDIEAIKKIQQKGKFDELGQWPIAVENSVLSILYSFKEDGVDELLKIVDNGGNSCLKAINLLCKLAAKGIEREKIVDSLIYIIKSFNEEDKYKVLGYFSQIKGHGKIERLYELYYKKFILEGNLDAAYDIILNLINIRGRYTREQLIFIKALALFDSELDMEMILKGENGTVSFANIEEQLRIKAAISFYSLNKMDNEINDRLYYLKNNSLDSELRAFLSETLE